MIDIAELGCARSIQKTSKSVILSILCIHTDFWLGYKVQLLHRCHIVFQLLWSC